MATFGQSPPSQLAIRGRMRQILISFAVMTVPMTLFSAVLLSLIYHYRITQNGSSSSNLAFEGTNPDGDAIYVNFSATIITTVASWCSTVAPLLLTFALTLASYPAAQSLFSDSQKGRVDSLPTPHQFALMLRMTSNASIGTLWQWIVYSLRRRGHRENQGTSLTIMTWILGAGSLISGLVFATDTWLHFATKTVALTQIEAFTSPFNASFQLNENCTDIKIYATGCTLNPAAANVFLLNGDVTLKLLTNTSSDRMVKGYEQEGKQYAYLAIPPKEEFSAIDYTATSLAVTSGCKPVTSDCFSEDRISGPVAFYKCSFAMEGEIKTYYENTIQMVYFTNSSATNNHTTSALVKNPYYYAAIASVNQNIGWSKQLVDEGGVINGLHGSSIFALLCSATVYDLEYTLVNNTVTRFVTQESNSSTTTIVQSSQDQTFVGNAFLAQAASTSARFGENIAGIAESFGFAYSQAALAVAAAGTVPQAPLEVQKRVQVLAARVPKMPLGFLVASNLLLVLLGVVLTGVAAVAARRAEVGEVQARLGISAVVAERFEWHRTCGPVRDVEDFFSERSGTVGGPRVTAVRNETGGWNFGTVQF